VTEVQRERSFLFAAAFADKLIRFLDISYSEEAVPWLASKKPNALDGSRLWDLLDGFDQNKAMLVHLVGLAWRSVDESAIEVLATQPISAYVDFDSNVDDRGLTDRLRPRVLAEATIQPRDSFRSLRGFLRMGF
jgi:hypothetical protein